MAPGLDPALVGAARSTAPRWTAWLPAALLFGTVLLRPAPAPAYHAEVAARSAVQFYSLRSPFGDPFVRRRRYTQTLGLRVDDIDGNPAFDVPELSFDGSVRLDADFGIEPREIDAGDTRFIPGLEDAPIDLMYAYLDAKRLLGGALSVRLGRQYLIDALGFWSFDGVRASLTTPVYFAVAVYAGFEQRGGLPLSSSRFEGDGVYRGDRSELERTDVPYFLRSERLAPAFGFALSASGLAWLQAELDYRRVLNRDAVVTSPLPEPDGSFQTIDQDRISREQIGLGATLTAAELGALLGGAVYDFYNGVFSSYRAALEGYVSARATLGVEYDYYLPTFDGDSIFNWFVHGGSTTIAGRARLGLGPRVELGLTSGVRLYSSGEDGSWADEGGQFLGGSDARYGWSDGAVGVRGRVESGGAGHVVGGDVTLDKSFEHRLYDTRVIVSVYDWGNELRPARDATSFSYVLGAGTSPFPATRIGVEWEHSINDLVGHRFRALATLDVELE